MVLMKEEVIDKISVKYDTANCSGRLELDGSLFGEIDTRQYCLSYVKPCVLVTDNSMMVTLFSFRILDENFAWDED